MAPAVPPTPGRPSRRVLLHTLGGGGSLLALVALSGCGLRLEHTTPPPAAARVPVPDEAALLRVLTATAFLAPLAARVRPVSPASARIAVLHRQHLGVVRDRLRTAGVPDRILGAAAPPATPAPSDASTTSPPATAAVLARAQATALTSDLLVVLPELGAANRPLVASIAACTAASTAELGATVTWPVGDALPGVAAAALLDTSRAVAYGLEVAAARVAGDERAALLAALTTVRRRVSSLLDAAGGSARPQPLGYPLPFAVTSAATVRRLVEHLLTGLVSRGLDPLTTGAVAPGSTAVTTVVRLQADAVGLARAWGVTPTAFPGMAA